MKVVLSICFLFSSVFAIAKDYYVSSAEEVNKLCSNASAGDKIILNDGTYTDAAINFTNERGTQQNNIVLCAAHEGKVFFEGNSTFSFTGKYFIVEGFTWQNGGRELNTKSVIEIKGEYNVFRNCAIAGYNNKDYNTDNKWVSIYGQHNTVTHCLLKDKFNRGATLVAWLKEGEEAHHIISYNYFLNRQNGPNADNGLESIRIGDSKTSMLNAHCIIAFNRFENCDGEIEIISNKSCHNSYLHNIFYNNNGGLTLRHGNNCIVDGNFFDGGNKEKSYGVRIIGEGHVVVNNYFYNLKGAVKEQFRAPVTIVNGLENTPQNGYFQVRRAVVAGNIFDNNITPDIRLGAKSKREGMTVAPDTVSVLNNIFFEDRCIGTEVFEDITYASHLTLLGNKVIGKCLSAPKKGFEKLDAGKKDGFDFIKDKKGNIVSSVEMKETLTLNLDAGANWIDDTIKEQIGKRKYTVISATEVGPLWLK